MRIEITKDKYEIMKEFFELHSIKVDIKSEVMDEMLVALGFAEKVPCIVELDISEEQIGEVCDICNDYDIAACDSEDLRRWDPVEHRMVYVPSEAQRKYERYGWIYWCLAYYEE